VKNAERAFAELLSQIRREQCEVIDTRPESNGPQGYSGSQVSYYQVTSRGVDGQVRQDRLVVKQASLLERRLVHHLLEQSCAVPPAVIPDIASSERAPIYMPFTDARPPHSEGNGSPLTASIADGLAGIHAANIGQPPAWLPHASDDFTGRLWLKAWHEQWEANLAQPDFAAEFERYTAQLEDADERLLRDLAALAVEGACLTVLNVDLIPDHIRLWRGRACFIDWEQSSYGPLYLDLPNAFSVETVLTYRDALARRGHRIPEVEFLERFHAISPYMGLRYLGFALWQWAQGGAERERGRWFLYYTLHLALHGR
jgi:aminoglycoside phosphotransferase (APT) family kinase protein